MVLIAQGVHWLPEAAMMEGAQLIGLGELLQGILLEWSRVARNIFAHLGREYEEATIDPLAVARGLLLEIKNRIVPHHQRTEASGGLHCGQRCKSAMLLVEFDAAGDIDIGHPVAIGHTEGFLVPYVPQNTLDAPPGLGLAAGIDERNPPRLATVLM